MITADEFLTRFFGEGNGIWPNLDQRSPAALALAPFLQALAYPGECPVILPRRRPVGLQSEIYVIGRDTAHAGRIRALLEACVAHHWVTFDGRVAVLDPNDPVDQAVLDFRGPGTTYVLKPVNRAQALGTQRALRRLVDTLAGRPLRTPTAVRPVGRMLREFDLALSAGAVEASASLLSEIESRGGISHENIAFLRVRRLSRLGRDDELLADGSLRSLVYTEPPFLVREAVLGAWARRMILPALANDGIPAALAAIADSPADIAMLVDVGMLRTQYDDVAAVCALVASARGDQVLLADFAETHVLPELLASLPLAESPSESGPESGLRAESVPVNERDVEQEYEPFLAPSSWLEWVGSLGVETDAAVDSNIAVSWAPAWTADVELAAAIDSLPAFAEEDLLTGVAAFLETDDPDHAAMHTAASLITRYLVSERFEPAQLAALSALLQIFVRGAPPRDLYNNVLQDIRVYANQWVSVTNAIRAIDIADAVACGPATSNERENFVAALLGPLSRQRSRLPASMRALAALVADDLRLELDWEVPYEGDAVGVIETTSALEARILLYSLDSGTLDRTKAAVAVQWPNAHVEICAEKVGSPTLRQHAHNADVIVFATRRATHAATTFISSNAREDSLIAYADGSGSASMLRAVESALGEWHD
ncbi:hypothetical protein GCM10027517_28950 [Phycicoccus ginsengisoli]